MVLTKLKLGIDEVIGEYVLFESSVADSNYFADDLE